MNYSLSTTRKIGKYHQKVIVAIYNTAESVSNRGNLAILERWTNLFVSLDPSGRTTEQRKNCGFNTSISDDTSNTGTYADGEFTIINEINVTPNITNFTVKNMTEQNMALKITEAYTKLTGVDLTDIATKSYLVSAVLTLHS